ncbi:tRNA (adenosine(37)-N6)-threonylcarbamoyltransferase complex dimerization subunit type 1 TsaB [Tumebacillus algifaecis]|uniref:tRNA (Adenosine(37)-N6)-threonylcarbamoyltransferase complex dimerization subunit type 1 TsaB n=1 Tax=Tumebacillus algifaecis TaxID=1214604 RepID=A0A223D5H7_9BACL|nr:tRNA (adenosine(37)-N6)-threonylcarbamoyltransferase complex dimerization subunit type 1 TsaB [Tumebacillus algifaecis]ASS76614.1 tRNA (adenosine(37)-N6)-threonylcarbamoyltransferase complex dimerization subunit type 1 TsaB [Tumebacillus algifaecis]
MPYLAIDTATQTLSVAVGEKGKLLGEATTQLSRNHSVKMMPLLEGLMSNLDLTPDSLQGIVVGRGPGSYTGVRIAVTAVKAFAMALNIPLVGVSSLDGLARHGELSDALVVPMFDARRKQAYTAFYEQQNGVFEKIAEDRLLVLDDLIKAINSRMVVRRLDKRPVKVLLLGDGAQAHREELRERLGEKAQFAPSPSHDFVRAAHLLDVGIPLIEAGETHDAATFAPEYLQLVEAEKKWLEAQQAGGTTQ